MASLLFIRPLEIVYVTCAPLVISGLMRGEWVALDAPPSLLPCPEHHHWVGNFQTEVSDFPTGVDTNSDPSRSTKPNLRGGDGGL
jgi:hypothetical protein